LLLALNATASKQPWVVIPPGMAAEPEPAATVAAK